MIRVLGGPKRLCDGLTRRDLLHVGSLGVLGVGLSEALGVGATTAAAGAAGKPLVAGRFGQAKSCILLFLYGSPSQLETFDPKPEAPEEIRGELKSIKSSVPGLEVCELLPKMARVMDKVTVLRTVSHPYPLHGVAFATTGIPRIDAPLELSPRDPQQWPFIGSVVDYVDTMKRAGGGGQAGGKTAPSAVPRNLVLPWAFSSQRVGEVARSGPYGGFLGQGWDPISTEFVGTATRKAKKTLADKTWDDFEPYRGITPESRLRLGAVSSLGPGLTVDRLDRRRTLLQQFEDARQSFDARAATRSGIERHRAMAYALLGSEKLRNAFDLGAETAATRELYGMTLFGQASLTARRLVEAGGRFLTVFWDEFGLAGTGWDTHWDHFPRMKDELLPGLDQTLSGLLIDLDQRGLLDETLVVCLSEHGRTPKLSLGRGGGRDHWSRCYSVLMAGGGVARGRVVGRSDKIASDPVERRISPKDVLATIYHLLGIDPATMLTDQLGRPLSLVPDAEVIAEAIA
jgi:hypothetical protein